MHRYGFEITDYVRSPPPIELAERLVELAPASITRAASGITGTEVVEGAVKLAREATGRPMILGFLGQYHGEATYLTAAGSTDLSEVTSNSAQYVSGLVFAPYPNQFRAPFHKGPGPYDDTIYVDYLEEVLLRHQVDPEQIAGVLIEPVLGEGGIVIPSAAFWERLTGALRALRLGADRRRGADRHRPLRDDVRGRALGPRAGADPARQGLRRRRDADRRDPRLASG